MSSGRAWTDEELVALGSFYPEHGASWDGWEDVLPGRTQRAIAMCAFKHHIRHLDASEPEEPTIRPCPFCGAMPSVGHAEHRGRMWWRIWCDNARCGTNVESIADSLERAAANWDRRA